MDGGSDDKNFVSPASSDPENNEDIEINNSQNHEVFITCNGSH